MVETQTQNQSVTQTTAKVNIPVTIYISSLSNSSRGVHYSLIENGEISKDAKQLVSTCIYYNNLNEKISFEEFSTIVHNSNAQNNTVKCDIITKSDNSRLIIEAHLAE